MLVRADDRRSFCGDRRCGCHRAVCPRSFPRQCLDQHHTITRHEHADQHADQRTCRTRSLAAETGEWIDGSMEGGRTPFDPTTHTRPREQRNALLGQIQRPLQSIPDTRRTFHLSLAVRSKSCSGVLQQQRRHRHFCSIRSCNFSPHDPYVLHRLVGALVVYSLLIRSCHPQKGQEWTHDPCDTRIPTADHGSFFMIASHVGIDPTATYKTIKSNSVSLNMNNG
mmetsp:Transcript_16479/g.45661  ORF Transcript_16479/g.45661 Transcript_16479/m.45661 type:complete len:224 (+) Transcript_16479:996-1667(+)